MYHFPNKYLMQIVGVAANGKQCVLHLLRKERSIIAESEFQSPRGHYVATGFSCHLFGPQFSHQK